MNSNEASIKDIRKLIENDVKKGRGSLTKVKELRESLASLESNAKVYDKLLDDIYKGCFMHRFRDVNAQVREVNHLG
jgi:hypothetical protein